MRKTLLVVALIVSFATPAYGDSVSVVPTYFDYSGSLIRNLPNSPDSVLKSHAAQWGIDPAQWHQVSVVPGPNKSTVVRYVQRIAGREVLGGNIVTTLRNAPIDAAVFAAQPTTNPPIVRSGKSVERLALDDNPVAASAVATSVIAGPRTFSQLQDWTSVWRVAMYSAAGLYLGTDWRRDDSGSRLWFEPAKRALAPVVCDAANNLWRYDRQACTDAVANGSTAAVSVQSAIGEEIAKYYDNLLISAGYTARSYSQLVGNVQASSDQRAVGVVLDYCDAGSNFTPNCQYGVPNAFWAQQGLVSANDSILGTMLLGQCLEVSPDVIAHELGHGIQTGVTALPLHYQRESGALNEALSDVFGESMDQLSGLAYSCAVIKTKKSVTSFSQTTAKLTKSNSQRLASKASQLRNRHEVLIRVTAYGASGKLSKTRKAEIRKLIAAMKRVLWDKGVTTRVTYTATAKKGRYRNSFRVQQITQSKSISQVPEDAKRESEWLLAEDVPSYIFGGPLRSMAHPDSSKYIDETNRQPATAGQMVAFGTYVYGEDPCVPSDANDYCWVHANSGVVNKLAWLLAVGGQFNGYSVTSLGQGDLSLGIRQMNVLFFDAMLHLQPDTGFSKGAGYEFGQILLESADRLGLSRSTVQTALLATGLWPAG